ncbi:hypothetical protein FDP41_005310 [Naegleria fowleri]|uniref:BTB domain-containing protein n=1 Tax=Naegleria fowleri TaxID=5763 RepID=A0A6A5BDM2_NAEFO|nr:uncharacterized protein FDP41_005310 [Naegleria fowleri]KAF0975983.1 hypothetical protein FDP41_005310 [Naegleria fowleri]CAG4710373.1 unnamed protein product [Naegleria fowleri]
MFQKKHTQQQLLSHENLSITCSNLFKLFNHELYSDFKIKLPTCQQTIYVSKGILAMNSEFFATLFQQPPNNSMQFQEFVQQELQVTGGASEENCLLKIIQFFYSGKIEYSLTSGSGVENQSNGSLLEILDLLLVSKQYMVTNGLVQHFLDILLKNIKAENCFELFFRVAVMDHEQDVHLKPLFEKIIQVMAFSFSTILEKN